MTVLSIADFSDLFQKCQHEIKQLKECTEHPEHDYLIFNLVIGMNHVFEWLLKDDKAGINTKTQCISKFNPYQLISDVPNEFRDLYNGIKPFPATNRNQEIIRKLCNKAKHFSIKPTVNQTRNFTCGAGQPDMQCGEPLAMSGAFQHYNYFVELDGKEVNVKTILGVQIDDWSKFISSIRS